LKQKMMQITPYTDPGAFLEKVQPFLERQEAINSLLLGIVMRLADHPEWIDRPPYLSVVEDQDNQIRLAAVITPPQKLLLAGDEELPQEALDLLIENLQTGEWPLPGVSARDGLVTQFMHTWAAATGRQARVTIRMRLYELREVIFPPHPPAGFLRQAKIEELDLVSGWRNAFSFESLHEAPLPNYRTTAARQIEAGTIFLWDDQGPVSMAASARPTAHGSSVNSVYTPPELRGRGYASACVAALSQQILDSGKQFCTLFTDLDYPTSNSIYQKIGYRPLCDFREYTFD
jgi:uncharacterized protein